MEIYCCEFVENVIFIFVELGGGVGIVNSYWDEFWFGGLLDLMIGYLGLYLILLSDIIVVLFVDIGYLIMVIYVVSEVVMVWLFLFLMGFVVRRYY